MFKTIAPFAIPASVFATLSVRPHLLISLVAPTLTDGERMTLSSFAAPTALDVARTAWYRDDYHVLFQSY